MIPSDQAILRVIRKPKIINLVENPTWEEKWDPAEMTWWDQVTDEFAAMSIDELASLVMNLARAVLTRKEYDDFDGEDAEAVARKVKDGGCENIEMAIEGTMSDAYEEAAIPSDSDIEEALINVRQYLIDRPLDDHWELIAYREPTRSVKDWSPGRIEALTFLRVKMDLADHVQYHRKPGHYDRYLRMSFGKSPLVQKLIEAFQGLPEESRSAYLHALAGELSEIEAGCEDELFAVLTSIMQNADIQNRVYFYRHWRETLEHLDERKKGIRKELLEYLGEA